jgi:CheY-like chemotaxis protein
MRRQPITSLPTSLEPEQSLGRVLYVDDDPFAAALLRATLEDAGFEVAWIPDARSALNAAATGTYDAYLLGVVRGGAGFPELAEKLAAVDAEARFVAVADCEARFPPSLDVCILKRRDMPRALVDTMAAASKRLRYAA